MKTKTVITGSGWDTKEWLGIIVFIIGVAAVTVGITMWMRDGFKAGAFYLIGGIIACILPFAITVPKLMKGTLKYEYPEAKDEELTKGDKIQVFLLTLSIACMFIGLGVALASALLNRQYGWDFAESYLYIGLLVAGLPFLLLVILGGTFIKD